VRRAWDVFQVLQFGSIHTLKSGQIISQEHYIDPGEALDAVGLSSDSASASKGISNPK